MQYSSLCCAALCWTVSRFKFQTLVFWLLFSQDKLTSFRLFSFLPSSFKSGFAVPTQNGTITSIPLNTYLSSLYLPLTSPQLNLILPVGSIFNVHKHETHQTIPPRCQIRHSLPCVHTHTHHPSLQPHFIARGSLHSMAGDRSTFQHWKCLRRQLWLLCVLLPQLLSCTSAGDISGPGEHYRLTPQHT